MTPRFNPQTGRTEHEWGCKCERCRNLISAMLATRPNGEYAFSDEEIQQIAEFEDRAGSQQ